MHIALTGIAGFIGSHLAKRLIDRGDEVHGLDNFDETLYPANLHRQNLATIQPATFVEADLLDAQAVDKLVQRADVVVHLAALAGVRPSLTQSSRYMRVNVEGTANILESCKRHGVQRLVFASSSSVYGAHSTVPFREDEPADRPASPYAASKRMGELLTSSWRDLHGTGIHALRFFTVYGPRQRPEMAIAKFARAILDGKAIPLYGDGSSARDYTYIDDIIDGVVASIDRVRPRDFRIYNLGGSRTTTLAELVAMLEQALGRTAIVERLPDQPGDVPITNADISRASAELDYRPRVAIADGLLRVASWLKG
jgi:UDP-glucuronate 4-epimerase